MLPALIAIVSACGAPTPSAGTPASASAAPSAAAKVLAEPAVTGTAQPSAGPTVDPSVVPEPPVATEQSAPPSPATADPLLAALDRADAGVVWTSCAPHPVTSGSVAETWCDSNNPVLDLKVVFNLYDDTSGLAASVSAVEQNSTGDTSRQCKDGGRTMDSNSVYTAACGFVVNNGTTFYTLAWRNNAKRVRGQIWSSDPASVWKWWYDNTPF